eukprot:TRINITY_DN8186_c0_g1_i2.p1 TRINITY_DN8186_c0_g1~~TRINITY_DN8186_c0_g1_i2.p1  ORF type:complete len:155 (+),score=10.33 TRINITY_DN8186_c0_g1_i2:265-729(+)
MHVGETNIQQSSVEMCWRQICFNTENTILLKCDCALCLGVGARDLLDVVRWERTKTAIELAFPPHTWLLTDGDDTAARDGQLVGLAGRVIVQRYTSRQDFVCFCTQFYYVVMREVSSHTTTRAGPPAIRVFVGDGHFIADSEFQVTGTLAGERV